jgi:hypothetical protein
LACVAELLDRDVVPALDGPVQHHARVAASLVAIVERELRLARVAADEEFDAIAGLLSASGVTPDAIGSIEAARSRLADALRAGMADDPAVAARVWDVLMGVARADLAISKPGHDEWAGE